MDIELLIFSKLLCKIDSWKLCSLQWAPTNETLLYGMSSLLKAQPNQKYVCGSGLLQVKPPILSAD